MKTRVKVTGKGTQEDPFRVDLPTYAMIPGTEEFSDPEKKVLASVEVTIPDDECDEKGQPSTEKMRRKYRGQPRWDRPDLKLPV